MQLEGAKDLVGRDLPERAAGHALDDLAERAKRKFEYWYTEPGMVVSRAPPATMEENVAFEIDSWRSV